MMINVILRSIAAFTVLNFEGNTSRTVTLDGPYPQNYEDQTKKIFYDPNNDGQVDSTEIHHYLWIFPENYTPTSLPYRTCTSVNIVKKNKKLQSEYEALMITKDILNKYVKECMSGNYRDASGEVFVQYISGGAPEEFNGWQINAHNYLWVVNYKQDNRPVSGVDIVNLK